MWTCTKWLTDILWGSSDDHIYICKRKNEKVSLENTKPISLREETGQSIYFMPIARKTSTYKKKENHSLLSFFIIIRCK
jgi:hypothetical protein